MLQGEFEQMTGIYPTIGLSDKAKLQLHASAEAVLEKSAERVQRFGKSS